MLRSTAEEDASLKQVIPYLVLRDGERWFLMRRTRAGGDARLHDLWSIGVGRAPEPGRRRRPGRAAPRVGGGARRRLRARLRARRAAQRRHDAPWGPSTWASCIVADAAGRPVAIRETDKLAGRVRHDGRGRRRPRRRWRPGAASSSTSCPSDVRAGPVPARRPRRRRCDTGRRGPMTDRRSLIRRRLALSLALLGLFARGRGVRGGGLAATCRRPDRRRHRRQRHGRVHRRRRGAGARATARRPW